jgi:hypothetical protein
MPPFMMIRKFLSESATPSICSRGLPSTRSSSASAPSSTTSLNRSICRRTRAPAICTQWAKADLCPPAGRVFQPVGRETQPPTLCSVGKMPAKKPAVKGEGLGPQGGHIALQRLCGQAAAVHRMDPGRRKPLNATNNTQNGVSAAE